MLKLIYKYYKTNKRRPNCKYTYLCCILCVHVYFRGDLGWFCHSVVALIVLLMKVKDDKGQV